jgi:Fe-S cluster assembly ATPase SufC
MKIAFKEFGPISEADIQLKPLTIFMGPNNTGKTWTAYAIAGLFSSRSFREYIKFLKNNEFSDKYPIFDEVLKKLVTEGNAKVDLLDIFDKYSSIYFNQLANLLPQWFNNFMGSRRNPFQDSKLEIELTEEASSITEKIKDLEIEGKFSVSKEGNALLNCLKKPGTTTMHFFTTDNKVFDRFPSSELKLFIARNILQAIQRLLYFDVYFFPSERTALTPLALFFSTKSESKDNVYISNEEKIKDADIDTLLPGPVVEILSLLLRARSAGDYSHRLEEAKKDKKILKYIELAEMLQTNIMGGKIDFSDPKPDPLRDLLFTPSCKKDISVEMPITSSVVKELSPLALYLYYFASSNELIVIDEPEMNLHPKAQAKIAEFLGMLVNSGINIIITTHSPYIIDHFMNLIKAYDNENKEELKSKFYLKNAEAFISKDKVAAYLFGNNEAKSVIDEEGFIDWHTFSKESETILNLYFEL